MDRRGCIPNLEGIKQALTNITAAVKRNDDHDKPRPPPPPATPLDFPSCEPKSTDPSEVSHQDLVKLFCNIQKCPTSEHLKALNASLISNVSLESLVPENCLPPTSWLQPPQPSTDTTPPILIPGGSLLAHETFNTRAKELQISNETGYKTIHRVPSTGKENPTRLIFFRKFWEEIDYMADYWDTSADKYTKPRSSPARTSNNTAMDVDELRKIAQNELDPAPEKTQSGNHHDKAPDDDSHDDTAMPDAPPVCSSGSSPSAPDNPTTASPPNSSPSPTEDLYTGRRNSTGSLMPRPYRERALFAFLETLALPFRSRLAEPKTQPKLLLGGRLLLPLPHMASVYRVPLDTAKARRGGREGPLCGVVAADYTIWRGEGEAVGEGAQERLHLLREIGCLLLLAQRRAREGKEEEVPGKGKWWAEVPRWGGGSGHAVFQAPEERVDGVDGVAGTETGTGEAATAAAAVPAVAAAAAAGNLAGPQKRRTTRPRRGHQVQSSSTALQPPSSLWEKGGVEYVRVGMDAQAGVDDIYLISSVNHHLSILHARVPVAYIEHITSGGDHCAAAAAEGKEEWWRLPVQRSEWFDLLTAEGRVQAMRGVWGVLTWLMRDQ